MKCLYQASREQDLLGSSTFLGMERNDSLFCRTWTSVARSYDCSPPLAAEMPFVVDYVCCLFRQVFAIDLTDSSQCQSIAEFVFELMGNPSLSNAKVPILLAFNKIDELVGKKLTAPVEARQLVKVHDFS